MECFRKLKMNKKIVECGFVMSSQKFLKYCNDGFFSNYDGFALPVIKNEIVEDRSMMIYPSNIISFYEKFPDVDIVVWYNR